MDTARPTKCEVAGVVILVTSSMSLIPFIHHSDPLLNMRAGMETRRWRLEYAPGKVLDSVSCKGLRKVSGAGYEAQK